MSARITEAMVEAGARAAFDVWWANRGAGYEYSWLCGKDAWKKQIRAALEAAAALSTEPGEAAGWRSMESAPRDGSKFLAYEKGRYFDCWWEDKGYGEAYWMDEADSEPNPSDWRTLPAAPLPEDTHHGR